MYRELQNKRLYNDSHAYTHQRLLTLLCFLTTFLLFVFFGHTYIYTIKTYKYHNKKKQLEASLILIQLKGETGRYEKENDDFPKT